MQKQTPLLGDYAETNTPLWRTAAEPHGCRRWWWRRGDIVKCGGDGEGDGGRDGGHSYDDDDGVDGDVGEVERVAVVM
ncbi:hypothetical protein Tco_1036702 [Tanacetum coccineum]